MSAIPIKYVYAKSHTLGPDVLTRYSLVWGWYLCPFCW